MVDLSSKLLFVSICGSFMDRPTVQWRVPESDDDWIGSSFTQKVVETEFMYLDSRNRYFLKVIIKVSQFYGIQRMNVFFYIFLMCKVLTYKSESSTVRSERKL